MHVGGPHCKQCVWLAQVNSCGCGYPMVALAAHLASQCEIDLASQGVDSKELTVIRTTQPAPLT